VEPYLVASAVVSASGVALGSAGFALSADVSGAPDLAHGELMVAGAFAALFANQLLGAPFAGAVVIGAAVGALAGGATHWLAVERLNGRVALLVASGVLAVAYRAAVVLGFGTVARSYRAGGHGRIRPLADLGVVVTHRQVAVVAAALALVVGLELLLQRTASGARVRAAVGNAANAGGDRWPGRAASAAGGALAAVGGTFLALGTVLWHGLGAEALLLAFAGAALAGRAGVGAPAGARSPRSAPGTVAVPALGGLAVGVVARLAPLLPFVAPGDGLVVAVALAVVAALVGPAGLASRSASA
jgi:branched-chain amino acid transport system permease protein